MRPPLFIGWQLQFQMKFIFLIWRNAAFSFVKTILMEKQKWELLCVLVPLQFFRHWNMFHSIMIGRSHLPFLIEGPAHIWLISFKFGHSWGSFLAWCELAIPVCLVWSVTPVLLEGSRTCIHYCHILSP